MAKCPICGGPMKPDKEMCDNCAAIMGEVADTSPEEGKETISQDDMSLDDIMTKAPSGGEDLGDLDLEDKDGSSASESVDEASGETASGPAEEESDPEEIGTGEGPAPDDLLGLLKTIRYHDRLDLKSSDFQIDENGMDAYHRVLDAIEREEDRTSGMLDNKEVYFYTANVARQLGDLDTAMEMVTKAIRANPDYGNAWGLKASLFDMMGKLNEALRSYDRAIKSDKDNFIALKRKAQLMEDLGRGKEAARAYERVLDLNESDYQAWESLGNIYYGEGDFTEAKKCYDKANKIKLSRGIEELDAETSTEIADTEDYKRALALFKDATNYMLECKNIGGDVSKAEELVDSIKSNLKAGKISQSLIDIDKMRTSIDKAYKDRVEKALETDRDYLNDVRDEIIIPTAEEMLDKAKEAFKENEQKKALNYAQISLEEAKKRFEEYDGAKNTIHVAWGRINDAKRGGIDVSVAEVLLEQARDAMKKKDFEKAKEYARKAEETATPEKDRAITKVHNILENAKAIRNELRDNEIDVKEVDRAIESSEGRLEKDDFDKAMEYAENALERAKEKRKRIIIKQAASEISTVESRLKEVGNLGLMDEILTPYKQAVTNIQHMFDNEKYDLAANEAKKIHADLDNVIGDALVLNYRKKIDKYRAELEDFGGKEQPEVQELMSEMNELLKLVSKKKSDELAKRFKDFEDKFFEIRKHLFLNSAPMIFSKLKRNVETLLSLDPEMERIAVKLEDIEKLFDMGNIEKSMLATIELENRIKEIKTNRLKTLVPDKIVSLRGRISYIREIGGGVVEAETKLQDAIKHFESEDYDNALTVLNETDSILHDEEIGAMSHEIEGLTAKVEELGISCDDMAPIVEDAKSTYRKGDTSGAEKYLLLGMKTLLTYVKDLLRNRKRRGMGVEKIEYELMNINKSVNENKLAEARMGIDRLIEQVQLKDLEWQAKNTLKEVRDKILDLRDKDRDISDMKSNFKRCKQLLQSGSIKKAHRKVEKLKDSVDREFTAVMGIEDKIKNKLYEIKKMVDDIQAMGGGLKVKDFKPMFDKAKKEYKKKNYERAMSYAKKCYSLANELYRYRNLIQTLKKVRKEIDTSEAKGIDTRNAEELLKKAKPAIEKKDFETALEFATLALEEVENAKKRRKVGEIIRKAFIKVNELKKKGYDATAAETALGNARTSLRLDEIPDAEKMAKKALEMAEKVMAAYLKSGDILRKVNELMKELKDIGYPLESLENTHNKIYEAINKDDLDLAHDLAENLISECENLKENYGKVKEQMDMARAKLNELTENNIPVPSIQQYVDEMDKAAKAGDLIRAGRLARIAWEEGEKTKHTFHEIMNLIQLAQSRIVETKKSGKDVNRAQTMFNEALDAMEQGIYDQARNKVKAALSETLAIQLVETASEEEISACPYCGEEIPKGSTYCPSCGKNI